jgi:REP-associated tyrosine transposase
MQGLSIRVARSVNRTLGRRGRVFAERYHAHVLRTPTETRRALVYVLCNGRKHLRARDPEWVDEASSAVWFPGFRFPVRDLRLLAEEAPVVLRPRSWLLREGWSRAGGPLVPGEAPARRGAR